MAPPSDPVADVWRSPELLGCVASFLDPCHAAWSFIHVSKAAAAAAYGDSVRQQPVSRTVSLPWALNSGLLATLAGRIHARAMCYRLTRQQRSELLCRCAAADCSRESLAGAVVAAGLSPPPQEVLIAAAAAGRLAMCRWLVEGLGCPGLVRLACLCLISAAGPGPGVVEEARAWLAPAAREGWSEEQEAKAASGDVGPVMVFVVGWRPGDGSPLHHPWSAALGRAITRRELEQAPLRWPSSRLLPVDPEFYSGPQGPLAVARLTQLEPRAYSSSALLSAAEAGHAEAVRFLLSRGARPDRIDGTLPDSAAACGGHIGVLQALHEAGCISDPFSCFLAGLYKGSLPVVEWLVEAFGARALCEAGITLQSAARSGSVQLLRALPGLLDSAAPGWVRYRGLAWAPAAASGCEEAVEWLARDCAAPEGHMGYREAASYGDLRMVQRLRRLGCRYGARDAEALAEAARRVPASATALPWLAEPGCPASWEAAAAEAREGAGAAAAEAGAREGARAQAEAEDACGVRDMRCCCAIC
ncbi:hypothetical protein HYH03_009600 [Edaphochlamys debaryana]|uniref:Ankyrin repeat domain-containing protein n=1 Tax=Edaphochlamys debaryana TaxID=47281 RepID=A0A835Y6X0_9CHLO|nr:hypothetical protein HYH03_009600 [Edaphochlamys debaryana]|eukprot:KAG2492109.1 hypothetical protein HYH03_009600 [Edaphochlamys debaryana]